MPEKHTQRRRRFEALWDAHHPAVLAYALRRTDGDAAHDVASEAFLAAWRNLDRAPEEPRAWLLSLARGALSNQRRGDQRRAALAERVAHQVRDGAGAPEDLGLADALATLGERDVEALLLVAWEGLSHAEAARVLGCSTPTFTVRLHRARGRLAAAMASAAHLQPVAPAGREEPA
ncbi:MAG: RNA polymerase sigma factor [Thermoleophilia bacterium]